MRVLPTATAPTGDPVPLRMAPLWAESRLVSGRDWVVVDLPFGPILELPEGLAPGERGLLEHKPSFYHNIGCVAGMLIEMSNDGTQYLIGDINELGGVCDDCRIISETATVHRYRIVWERTS